jgi:hypothetical protein
LTHYIIFANINAREARATCASAMEAMRRRWPVAYAQQLSFVPEVAFRETTSGTADPDREVKALPVR